jgi:predicted metal-binding membrane protein
MTYLTNLKAVWAALLRTPHAIGRLLDALFEKHKFVRRTLVFWSVSLITWVTLQMFTDIALINEASATAYTVLVGALGVVLGFYQWMREKDNEFSKETDRDG